VNTQEGERRPGDPTRRILLLTHTGREQAREVTHAVVSALAAHGLLVRMLDDEAKELDLGPADGVEPVGLEDAGCEQCELAVVIGGDGTILRAAELTHTSGTPLLGVNLGHVGFLAEAEPADLAATVRRIADRDFEVEERLTLDVEVSADGEVLWSNWALNEASVEKSSQERMMEVVIEVDGRPMSQFGCDGVVMATATGSTAYAFSGGGPIVWPDVEALLLVPLNAHALFSRPVVVTPQSTIAVEVLGLDDHGVVWCDGRRGTKLVFGARVEVRGSDRRLKLARLSRSPFTDRLVAKFGLPVRGWRGVANPPH
jgi:NAD+ kinase